MKKKNFIELIMQRKNLNIKKRAPKPPKWLYPLNAQTKYTKELKSLNREIKDLVKEILYPQIESMIQEVLSQTPNDRNDNYLGRLQSLIIYIKSYIKPKLSLTILEAAQIGEDISRFNKNQFHKFNESVFGIDIFTNEPWLSDQLSLFAAQNAQLITSLQDQELDRVAGEIERGLQQGLRLTDIKKGIQKSFGISDRRATLIARDQTQKLNSSLTRLRQQEVGVEEYIWQTSGDERVRPTHRENDGKKFRWDTPPKVTGHPGHDVNCRCVALAVLDKLLNLG